MLISVCIPHYNRSKYLLKVLESIRVQDHPDVEVLISDDCSTDDSSVVIPEYIASIRDHTHVRFNYFRQPQNLGYDGNLRAALAAGKGEYLFTLGNDDALPETTTLSELAEILTKLNNPDIAFVNSHSYDNPNQIVRRARSTAVIGSGPDVAVKTFRSFSFVGGLAIKRSAFEEYNTNRYDGSVYFQIYLGARIISSGGTLASIDKSMVAKDVSVPGKVVNSYLDNLHAHNRKIHRHTGGLERVGTCAGDGILPYVSQNLRQRYLRNIYAQILLFTYPYWLFNYREHGSFRAAINLALGCFPTNLVRIPNVALHVYLYLIAIYACSTTAGLFVPVKLLSKLTRPMSWLSKKVAPRNEKALATQVEIHG
jgi:glycosyltransferase involved in cell wall biosynthesis